MSETDVEAFPDGASEQCVLPVVRVPAMLLTPTCDLREDYWLFSPLRNVADNPKIVRRTLHSTTKGYSDIFGIYAHPAGKLEESFINFHDIVSVPSEPFRIFHESRIANLSKESQQFLEDKLARFLSRGWGFATHEKVEEDGFYRCRICARYYGLDTDPVYLKAGEKPPECKNCSSTKQNSSWELLLKHKRSRPIKQIRPKPRLFTRILRAIGWTKAQ